MGVVVFGGFSFYTPHTSPPRGTSPISLALSYTVSPTLQSSTLKLPQGTRAPELLAHMHAHTHTHNPLLTCRVTRSSAHTVTGSHTHSYTVTPIRLHLMHLLPAAHTWLQESHAHAIKHVHTRACTHIHCASAMRVSDWEVFPFISTVTHPRHPCLQPVLGGSPAPWDQPRNETLSLPKEQLLRHRQGSAWTGQVAGGGGALSLTPFLPLAEDTLA